MSLRLPRPWPDSHVSLSAGTSCHIPSPPLSLSVQIVSPDIASSSQSARCVLSPVTSCPLLSVRPDVLIQEVPPPSTGSARSASREGRGEASVVPAIFRINVLCCCSCSKGLCHQAPCFHSCCMKIHNCFDYFQ